MKKFCSFGAFFIIIFMLTSLCFADRMIVLSTGGGSTSTSTQTAPISIYKADGVTKTVYIEDTAISYTETTLTIKDSSGGDTLTFTEAAGWSFFSPVNINGAYILPSADGNNGDVLSTNGAGVLSFVSASSAASLTQIVQGDTNITVYDTGVGTVTQLIDGANNYTAVDGNHEFKGNLEATTYGSDGSITDAELLYINSLSSNAQDQLDARALESVVGTSIGTGLLLDGAVLKTQVGLQSIAGLSETNGGIPYGTADNAYAWLAAGAEGTLLMGNGAGAPSFLAAGATTEILVGGGAADPVWTTATGTGAPARATSPVFVTPTLGAATATSIAVPSGFTATTAGAEASALTVTGDLATQGARFLTVKASAVDYTPSVLTTDSVIILTTSGGAIGYTISTEDIQSGSSTLQRVITVIDGSSNAGTNNITIGVESGTINGGATVTISTDNGTAVVFCDGTNCIAPGAD